jgi:hypothetical protein
VDAASLCDVVRGLLLGVVGDVAGHGGSDDKGAGLALAEVQTDSTSAVVSTSQIGFNHLVPLLNSSIEDAVVGGFTRIGNEDIDLAKVLHNVFDKLLHIGIVADGALVGLDLDTVLLAELLCVLLGTGGAGVVGNSQVGAELCAAAGSFDPDSSWAGCSRYDDDLALEGEEVLELLGFGNFGWHLGSVVEDELEIDKMEEVELIKSLKMGFKGERKEG